MFWIDLLHVCCHLPDIIAVFLHTSMLTVSCLRGGGGKEVGEI